MEVKTLDLTKLCEELQEYNPDYHMRAGELCLAQTVNVDFIGEVEFYTKIWDNCGNASVIISYKTNQMSGFNHNYYTGYTYSPMIIDHDIRRTIRDLVAALGVGAFTFKYQQQETDVE